MARRFPNPRLVKIHRSYSVRELAALLGKHPNTIRNWQATGLETFRNGREALAVGSEVRRFLEEKRNAAKRPCPPGSLFCFKCKKPRRPAFNEVELSHPLDCRSVLTGICPVCTRLMKQTVSEERLGLFRKIVEVTIRAGEDT